ncbi:hypothetical protein bcgnr5386_54140 [Bacillus cereus]
MKTYGPMIYDRIRSWIAGSFNTPITYTAGELVIKEPYTKVLQTHVNSGQLDWAPDQPNSMYYLLQQSSVRLVLKYRGISQDVLLLIRLQWNT